MKTGGVNLTWIQRQLQNPRLSMGRFVFNRAFTRNPMNLQQGDAIADLLLGAASQADISNDVHGDERMPYYDFYVQDQWRATPRPGRGRRARYSASARPVRTS